MNSEFKLYFSDHVAEILIKHAKRNGTTLSTVLYDALDKYMANAGIAKDSQ